MLEFINSLPIEKLIGWVFLITGVTALIIMEIHSRIKYHKSIFF